MSRSGYSEDCEYLDLWRGAVERAIKGKRGQAFLKKLEAALLALTDKKLCSYDVANPETGEVCAIGAVALKRRLDKGMERKAALEEIAKKFRKGCDAEEFCDEFKIAASLAKEITYMNDEEGSYGETAEKRYMSILAWVQSQIMKI